MTRVNAMHDYVTFIEELQAGPEAGMTEQKEVFNSFAEIYEPSTKDIALGNLETSNTNITLIIRNPYPEFTPKVNNTFKVLSGIYGGQTFNIKSVTPKDSTYLKLVGESHWD